MHKTHNARSFCAIIIFIDTHYTKGQLHTLIVYSMPHRTLLQYLRTRFTTLSLQF